MSGLVKNTNFIKKGTAVFKSGTQSAVSTLTDFSAFELEVSNDSDSIVKDSLYQVTLKAGRKFKITCTCHVESFSDTTNGFAQFNLVIDGSNVTFYQATVGSNFERSGPLTYIYTATADTTLKVTVGVYGGTATIGGGNSVCLIEELEAYIPVVTGTQYADVIKSNGTSITLDAFSSLGSGAPKIKIKKLTGTTGSTQGASISIAHGLTRDKILSLTVMVFGTGDVWLQQGYASSAGFQFDWYLETTNISINNSAANSSNILSKPIMILVTYEE